MVKEAKYTAGPWKAVDGPSRWNVTTATGERTFNICAVNTDRMEQEANARLIASAPELLDAMKMITAVLIAGGYDPESKGIVQCRAAIAKATGDGQ